MSNIKLNLPGAPFTGRTVTFCAPCGCDQVTDGLSINGEIYTVVDAMGNCVTGKGGAWCSGAQVSVVLDVEGHRAFLQTGGFGKFNGDEVIPVLKATGDTTDRTADILEMLNTYGVCQLGKGSFYIANLDMPEKSTIQGFGAWSELVLLPSVTDGYAVGIGPLCTIQDVQIYGGAASGVSSFGTRHGIMCKGNASGANNTPLKRMPTVTNCYIAGFTGGGITCHDTGLMPQNGLNVTNCKMENCGAGINIDYYSEYHRFTNVAVSDCLYGCVNNGGSNIFVNCMFSNNHFGIHISGRLNDDVPNDSRGSAIGCTFNHNAVLAIQVLGATQGYVFQGCQVFDGAIEVEDSFGIVFNGLNIGPNVPIIITDGGSVQFSNCAFDHMPTFNIVNNDNVKIYNCSTWSGEVFGVITITDDGAGNVTIESN